MKSIMDRQQKPSPSGLRDLPSRLLAQTSLLVGKIVSSALAMVDGSRYEYAVLATLHASGAASQAELCRLTGIDRSDMNEVAGKLEKCGYVERRIDPSDRRQKIVELTATGQRRYGLLDVSVKEAQRRAFAPLTETESQLLLGLLRKLHDHHALSEED
jgi:DNA-binding MarR family transcriptional regulator